MQLPAGISPIFLQFQDRYEKLPTQSERNFSLWEFCMMYWDSYHTEFPGFMDLHLKRAAEESNLEGECIVRVYMIIETMNSLDLTRAKETITWIENNVHRVKDPVIFILVKIFSAISNSYQGNYSLALQTMVEMDKTVDPADTTQVYGWLQYNFGVLYTDIKDYDKALERLNMAIDYFVNHGFSYGAARSKIALATVAMNIGQQDRSEMLLKEVLPLIQEVGSLSAEGRVTNDLAILSKKNGALVEAHRYILDALRLRKQINHLQGVATTLSEAAEIEIEMGLFEEAEQKLLENIDLCLSLTNRSKLAKAYKIQHQLYRKQERFEEALMAFEKYYELHEELHGESVRNTIKGIESSAAKRAAEQEAEIERLRNVELKSAYDIIELKNREIFDSIRYAKRIQYALLANEELIASNLQSNFVYFQPKDIVSGDFYYASETEKAFYIAVCDSTGHGVPGAFMSLLNISFLNEAINVKDIEEPGEILDHVRNKLIESLSREESKDGMDCVLLAIPKSDPMRVRYAAANNAPVVVRGKDLTEYPADKMPVGKGLSSDPFKTSVIDLQKGDIVYLFTDGFADQFGGNAMNSSKPGGKKYKHRNFLDFIQQIAGKGLAEQKELVKQEFESWKGDLEQLDDICVIGISF